MCVREALQHRIAPRWFKQFQERPEGFVQDRIGVADIKIQRVERATKRKLRLIIQGAAPVTLESLGERPAQDVAQRVKVEMKVERHAVIQTEVIVVDRALMHERDAEPKRLFLLSPDKKANASRHSAAEFAEV